MLSTKMGLVIASLILVVVALSAAFFSRDSGKKESITETINLTKTKLSDDLIADTSFSLKEWKKFTAPQGQFEVLLPSLPQHASEVVPLLSGQGAIKYDMYIAQKKDGSTFMISVIQYPPSFDVSNANSLLESVMKEMQGANKSNTIQNKEVTVFNTYPALDFWMKNDEFATRSKTFLCGHTLFVLTFVDRNFVDLEQDFSTFINSFQLKGPT
jgi:hypothetical protein